MCIRSIRFPKRKRLNATDVNSFDIEGGKIKSERGIQEERTKSNTDTLQLFEGQPIRTAWDNEKEE